MFDSASITADLFIAAVRGAATLEDRDRFYCAGRRVCLADDRIVELIEASDEAGARLGVVESEGIMMHSRVAHLFR